ncbi:MAG TPA: SCE4755 family polysaccharide monooxygenase-like protein [Kofleriaceae bacterium]|nr:SCE4755 family polysaccharide monooxygenase-like protein [Kofleriaceae bacterium]
MFTTALLVGAAAPALAHVQLRAPLQRTSSQKSGPCGATGSVRGTAVCTFRPGQTITIAFDETVEHPGHFRIAFDPDGQDFVDPVTPDDINNSPEVLLDDIPDRDVRGADPSYTQVITLPDVECDNCTLQLIQVMTDKPPFGDGNDLYYQCADIVLSADAPETPEAGCLPGAVGDPPDAGPGGGGDGDSDGDGEPAGSDAGIGADGDGTRTGAAGGCAAAGGGSTGGALALLLAFGALARRRRRAR